MSEFLKYELHIKGTVLCLWSYPRCIKIWILIYCGGLKFPHRAVVLLVLESDGAYTSLNGQSARKSKVLILVCFYKTRGDIEQELWGYWLPEECIKQWCDKRSGYGCLRKNCGQGENEAVTLLYLITWPIWPTYRVKAQDSKRYVSHKWPVSPVTELLPLCFLCCFSGLRALLLLTYTVACKSEIFHELDSMDFHPHNGFHFSELLAFLCHYYSRIFIIWIINFEGSEYRQVSNFYSD